MTSLRTILLFLCCGAFSQMYSQDTSADSLHIYHSINEGLQEPEKVRTLEVIHLQDGDSLELLTKFPHLTSLSLVDYHSGVAPEPVPISRADSIMSFINVVPNPYYGLSDYETDQFSNIVKITNLPANRTV